MNANPKCRLCGRAMVWIGIGGGAEPACPEDCSACVKCKHPKAELKHTASRIESRPGRTGGMISVLVKTMACSRCSATSDVDGTAAEAMAWRSKP